MIDSFRAVIDEVVEIGYDSLISMPDTVLAQLLRPLGLAKSRVTYLRSLNEFIISANLSEQTIRDANNDELIRNLADSVSGAGYKVAQCAVLYCKGYHCGIFPVDSGMKDVLGPCLGIELPAGPRAHEVMRMQIEDALNRNATHYHALAHECGYEALQLPDRGAPIWWAHLVLIYFKRMYCNRRQPGQCPLLKVARVSPFIGTMCLDTNPLPGGYRYIILEGLDRAGKSTIAAALAQRGYAVIHCAHDPDQRDIATKYTDILAATHVPTVFDRSFLSEWVYGPVLRGHSRLTREDLVRLLAQLAAMGAIVIYVEEEDAVLQARLHDGTVAHKEVFDSMAALKARYESCMLLVAQFLPMKRIHSRDLTEQLSGSRPDGPFLHGRDEHRCAATSSSEYRT